ncbi:MAG: DPP IV N-terminal domain-containing protein, partial [Chitinophagales bacterium]
MSFDLIRIVRIKFFALFLLVSSTLFAQDEVHWSKDGNSYFLQKDGGIVQISLVDAKETVLLPSGKLTPQGSSRPIGIRKFAFSDDGQKLLIYTNSKKVWRYDTRGDYWVYDFQDGSLKQLGLGLPPSSLMFAKISPDGRQAAYVSRYNLYVEDLSGHHVKQLTQGGNRKEINGTFDWAYEEEFFCRDGFRWSPDSKQIAYWQIEAQNTTDYLMIDNTDSIYPVAKPVEYPIAGVPPSPFKIGVVNILTAGTKWMDIPTDPVLQSYVPRMEWAANSSELIIQHLNRKQNESWIMLCNAASGKSNTIYTEKDSAWIDIQGLWDFDYWNGGWDWLKNGKEFLWASEKDGWRHLYRVSRDGKTEIKVTVGNYDVMNLSRIDEKNNYVYFIASPDNATQAYLYRARLDGKGKAELISPTNQVGTHNYDVSPSAKYAKHSFSNYYTPLATEWISLPDHSALNGNHNVYNAVSKADKSKSNIEFFKVKTEEDIEMDAWMVKPQPFDPAKKYPVLFFVYTEPWGQNVKDEFGTANNFLYQGNLAKDGYIYISIDNRGTPVPKGRAWRKSVYRKIGLVNIRDQAMAA